MSIIMCVYIHEIHMRYDAVCFVSHVERYMYLLLSPSLSYSSPSLLSP